MNRNWTGVVVKYTIDGIGEVGIWLDTSAFRIRVGTDVESILEYLSSLIYPGVEGVLFIDDIQDDKKRRQAYYLPNESVELWFEEIN
jgi:hypothetical protein